MKEGLRTLAVRCRPVHGEGPADVAVALTGDPFEGLGGQVPPFRFDFHDLVSPCVHDGGQGLAVGGDDLAALQEKSGGRPRRLPTAEAAPADPARVSAGWMGAGVLREMATAA